jgi:hypothetical protein
MAPPIVPCKFVAKNQEGDFAWMIQQEMYDNCFFIFNDQIEFLHSYRRGNGNSWIRPHTINNPEIIRPRSANVPVASIKTGGFTALNTKTINCINSSITRIQNIINEHDYDTIYFAALDDDKIAISNYTVASAVRNYITSAIMNLT